MQGFFGRYLRLAVPGALFLAGLGWVYAQVMLTFMSRFGEQEPTSAEVVWRTPMMMAIYGLLVILVYELIMTGLGRRKPKPPAGGAV